jgi:hypothetical protein
MQLFKKFGKMGPMELIFALVAAGALILSFTWNTGGGGVRDAPATTEEERLASILSRIEGAGNVSVYIYESDVQEAVSVFKASSATAPQRVKSAIVVAQGAGNLTVKTSLMRATMTALKLPASAVEIFSMEEDPR